jgi:prepilin-type N-terminal cleavage/methylation domain-containing protein
MKIKSIKIKKYIRAFTIVELLVVMAVIGILVSLAVVGIQAIQRSQRETVIANDLRNIQAALVQYYAKYRAYPAVVDDLSDELKFDNQGTKQGICLAKPQEGDYISGDFSCDVESTDPSVMTHIYSIVPTQQLGIFFDANNFTSGSTTYSTYDCSTFNPDGGNTWMLGYLSGFIGESRQQYALFSSYNL